MPVCGAEIAFFCVSFSWHRHSAAKSAIERNFAQRDLFFLIRFAADENEEQTILRSVYHRVYDHYYHIGSYVCALCGTRVPAATDDSDIEQFSSFYFYFLCDFLFRLVFFFESFFLLLLLFRLFVFVVVAVVDRFRCDRCYVRHMLQRTHATYTHISQACRDSVRYFFLRLIATQRLFACCGSDVLLLINVCTRSPLNLTAIHAIYINACWRLNSVKECLLFFYSLVASVCVCVRLCRVFLIFFFLYFLMSS